MSTDQLDLRSDSVIRTAMKRWERANDTEHDARDQCLDDLRFSTSDQWPGNIRQTREGAGKPCLQMDQTQQSVHIVCNEYRQQRPAIEISPIGDGADIDTAEIIQGVVRHIEVLSDAEIAYDNAHEFVTRIGFGSWRMRADYIDEDSKDQEIFIEPIRNPFSVYRQPGVPNNKCKWLFIVADMPREEYDNEYPDSEMSGKGEDFIGIGNPLPDWFDHNNRRVAEYFTVEETKRKGKRSKLKVVWRKINGVEVLEGPITLPGSVIPVFTAYGDDIDVDGKRYLAGLIRNAKDPQRYRNYMTSAIAERMALSKTAPYIAVAGATAGFEKLWENAENVKVLYYNQVDVAGKPAPRPERDLAEPAIQGAMEILAQASADVKAAMGVYDPSLGQRKGDESGKAIERLQQQGSLATLNFSDNMAREMRAYGSLMVEWIRYYYNKPRIQRIIMPDGSSKQVVVHNGPDQAGAAQKMMSDKITKIFDIGTGRYDVVTSVGPSYQTKRQEAVATQMEFLKMLPPQMGVNYMDLIVSNMDWPQSQEFAKRAKKMLPPQLQEDDGSDPEVKVQKLEQQLQQAMQQHDLLTKALQDAHQVVQTKQIEQQGKMQIAQMQEMTKQEVVKMQEATKLAVAQINASKDMQQSFAENEIKQYDLLHSAAHDVALQKDQQAHEQAMGAQQIAAGQQEQTSDQQHEAGMTAVDQAHEQTMAEQQNQGDTGNE
jgi:hypothetical protein